MGPLARKQTLPFYSFARFSILCTFPCYLNAWNGQLQVSDARRCFRTVTRMFFSLQNGIKAS